MVADRREFVSKDTFPGWPVRLLFAVLIRPKIWLSVLVSLFRLMPKIGVKRNSPSSFKAYMRMRAEVSHGNPDVPTRAKDILEWLIWCHSQRRLK